MVKRFCTIMIFYGFIFAESDERGDPDYRRKTNIDVNKVRATMFNFGITGRTAANPGEIPYEWPVTSRCHIK